MSDEIKLESYEDRCSMFIFSLCQRDETLNFYSVYVCPTIDCKKIMRYLECVNPNGQICIPWFEDKYLKLSYYELLDFLEYNSDSDDIHSYESRCTCFYKADNSVSKFIYDTIMKEIDRKN